MSNDIKISQSNDVGAPPVATEDIGGRHYQVMKLAIGEAGTAALVDNANPIPISVGNFPVTQTISGTVTANTGLNQPLTDAELRASAVAVDVSILPLPTGASTESTLISLKNVADIINEVASDIKITIQALNNKTIICDTNAVSVDNFPVTQEVSVASGVLTNTELRATAVPVSDGGGSVTIDGNVGLIGTPTVELATATLVALETVTATISNFPTDFPNSGLLDKLEQVRVLLADTLVVSGPLTDTQLRADAVPISGTVSVGNLPATQSVSGTVELAPATLTALESITVSVGNFPISQPVSGTVAVDNFPATQSVSGTVELAPATLTALESVTATVSNLPADYPDVETLAKTEQVRSLLAGTLTVSGPLTNTQLRAAAVPITGNVAINNFPSTQPISGSVTVDNLPVEQPISGNVAITNFPSSQTVSAATLPLPTGAATETTLSALKAVADTINAAAVALNTKTTACDTGDITGTVSVSNFPATQPVSGTVAVSGTLPVSGPLTDTELRASAVPISDGGGSVTVDGTVAIGGTPTVELATATLAALETITATISNLPADYPDTASLAKLEQVRTLLAGTLAVSGPLTDTQLRASEVPISVASLPLPVGAATDSALTQLQTTTQAVQDAVVTLSNVTRMLEKRLAPLSRMSFSTNSELRAYISGTLSSVSTLTTGNIGVGDCGKQATAIMLSKQSYGCGVRRGFVTL
jgi:hypothetical protein